MFITKLQMIEKFLNSYGLSLHSIC